MLLNVFQGDKSIVRFKWFNKTVLHFDRLGHSIVSFTKFIIKYIKLLFVIITEFKRVCHRRRYRFWRRRIPVGLVNNWFHNNPLFVSIEIIII